MRISCNERDRGYAAFRKLIEAEKEPLIFLDGVRVLCETADEELGEVIVQARGDGAMIVDPNRPGHVLRETLRGRVRIRVLHPPIAGL